MERGSTSLATAFLLDNLMLARAGLEGARVLIVEDEALVAIHIAEMIREFGCVPLGPVRSVEAALATIDDVGKIDCATVDVRLEDGISGHVAGALMAKGIPFVICSAYSINLPDFRNVPIVEKPFQKEQFKTALERALNSIPRLSPHKINGFALAGMKAE
jgi:two-component SAPR family response regulator